VSDLFPKLVGINSATGVAMNAPPANILPDVTRMVTDAIAALPDGDRGALVGIATKHPDGTVNVNLALAARVGSRVEVAAWLGRTWGEPLTAGVVTRIRF
jgi:hypothetical protein